MIIETAKYGRIELDDSLIFTFEQPLLGLEDYPQYGLVHIDKTLPFAYLQAIGDPRICLLVADPFAFYPNYEFHLPDESKPALGDPAPEAVGVWTTVSLRNDLKDATTNLLAPILLNMEKQRGGQIVLHDSKWGTQTPLFPAEKGEK